MPKHKSEEMRVRSLGWEDPLEEMATHSSILAWRIPWILTLTPTLTLTLTLICLVGYSPWGHKESDTIDVTSGRHRLSQLGATGSRKGQK